MANVKQIWQGLLFSLQRDRFDRELEEEMRFPQMMRAEENRADGLSEEEVRRVTRWQFGNQALLQEASREMWAIRSIETLWQDLHYGARILLKQPGFTLIAVLPLALGIGANTAIFSVIDALLLRKLPVRSPEQLVTLEQTYPDGSRQYNYGFVDFERFRQWRVYT
jgi:hypothetical protein